jgi:methionine synthase I (cobalamin-dependent)
MIVLDTNVLSEIAKTRQPHPAVKTWVDAQAASDTFINCYPNAGLPNPMSDTGFDETPEITSRLMHGFAQEGLINIVGCCGTP